MSGIASVTAFTFHNVSINSPEVRQLFFSVPTFTFHNVSINSDTRPKCPGEVVNLHSTMFLLILTVLAAAVPVHQYLHSTMFLLIPLPRQYPL